MNSSLIADRRQLTSQMIQHYAAFSKRNGSPKRRKRKQIIEIFVNSQFYYFRRNDIHQILKPYGLPHIVIGHDKTKAKILLKALVFMGHPQTIFDTTKTPFEV